MAHLELQDPLRRPIERRDDHTVWHTFAGGRINLVLSRILQLETGVVTVSSNLSVKLKSTSAGVGAEVAAIVGTLAAGNWPPESAWAELDTDKRTFLLSQFQACLPAEAEQEYLRRVFFDRGGAEAWLAQPWRLPLVDSRG